MTKHIIAGQMGSSDTIAYAAAPDERLSVVSLLGVGDRLGHGIGSVLNDMRALGLTPAELGVDLLVLAAHVYAADTRISRESEAQDSWTREIGLLVPVSQPDAWGRAAPTLKRLLDFLTGDRWSVAFRSRPANLASFVVPPKKDLLTPTFDDIGLFSGGLDSLIGAIDVLTAGRSTLLVSHAGEGLVSKAQEQCFAGLKEAFPSRTLERLRLWLNFDSELVPGVGSEDSTRGRSFLFFALGVSAGTGLGKPFTLRVPENGLIALNVPLDPLRLGALSTRTTHPFYMSLWNEVMTAVGIPGRLHNPYWDRTKGEMAKGCADPTLLRRLAPLSMSCSHPTSGRWRHIPQGHCGYCLPCLIRRASLLGFDDTVYSLPDLSAATIDTKRAEGKQIRSLQVAISRLAKSPALASILIHKPGPLTTDPAQLAALSSVYQRGMTEVGQLLQGVRTTPI